MTSWVDDEMQTTDMPDVRLKKRLTKILTSLSKNAEESIPASCQEWSETKSIYRFFDNHRVGLEEILSGHKAATVERIAKQPMVLLAQDTIRPLWTLEQKKTVENIAVTCYFIK
jgi:hypothetical protein